MAQNKALTKLQSLFKEEQWGRIEPKDIGISKFKILDDLFNNSVSENSIDAIYDECLKHLDEHQDSITASYLIGLIGYHKNNIEDSRHLRRLTEIFLGCQKWAVAEMISEKILEYGENSFALRSLAVSLQHLGRSKEAIPVFESLLKIDRFDPDVAKKLSLALVNEDPNKSIYYMKLAIEGYIKNKEFEEVSTLWNKLVPLAWEDRPFFERLERMLVDAKQYELIALLMKILFQKYKDENKVDESIEVLKTILAYKSDDTSARKDLIKAYNLKYGTHSQFDQFLELSKLGDNKTQIKFAIQDFEKNIVFDKGNYVFHNSWKLGKISDIDSEFIMVDFKDKKGHKMSIQMALSSLVPVPLDHLYVKEYENFAGMKSMFDNDIMEFFQVLLKSYSGEIKLSDIKYEIVPEYLDEKSWTKWWSKTRTQIKKNAMFGVSDKNKDIIFMRDKPVTYEDGLLEKFSTTDSFSAKLGIAMEFVNNADVKDNNAVADFFINYFLDRVKEESSTRLVLSYFVLKDFNRIIKDKEIKLESIRQKVVSFVKNSNEIPLLSRKISSYDYKKDLVNLIQELREDWVQIYTELLFESPIRIHKYIFNKLLIAHAYNAINTFIDRIISSGKQHPEVLMWVVRNIFTKSWNHDWLDYSREDLTISFFRTMSDLKKLELEGTRIKNMALDIISENDYAFLRDVAAENNQLFLAKVYDLFIHILFVEDAQSEKFMSIIKSKYADFNTENVAKLEVSLGEKLITTKSGYAKKQAELDHMKNVEMANLSKELAKVSEISVDMRDNVDYAALLEKQTVLQTAISKLDEDMKQVTIIDLENIPVDVVNIGNKVTVENLSTNEKIDYVIIGPWDADFERGILSYRSPIAKAVLGKKVNDGYSLKIDDVDVKFKIIGIDTYRGIF